MDSEDALQISVHKLETVTSKYGLKISKSKKQKAKQGGGAAKKVFKGKDPGEVKL